MGNIIILITFVCALLLQFHAITCQVQLCTVSRTSSACRGMSGNFLPRDYSPDLRFLYIVDSDVSALQAADYDPLPNLMTLHIDNCSFPFAPGPSPLARLQHLDTLEVTRSNLSENYETLFQSNEELVKLFLEGNNIREVKRDFFKHLRSVESIDISLNLISEVEADTFKDLPSLKEVRLTHNRIGKDFDPSLLFISPSECSVCKGGAVEEECPSEALGAWKGNRAVEELWREFSSGGALFLEGNPVCEKLRVEPLREPQELQPAAQESLAGGCPEHQKRRQFFAEACSGTGRRSLGPEPSGAEGTRSPATTASAQPQMRMQTPPPLSSPPSPPVAAELQHSPLAASVSTAGLGAAAMVVLVVLSVVGIRRSRARVAKEVPQVDRDAAEAMEKGLGSARETPDGRSPLLEKSTEAIEMKQFAAGRDQPASPAY